MSLCPKYCDCPPCKHGVAICDYECSECRKEWERKEHQKQHEASVARQKNRLKVAPWRRDADQ